eukprot:943374-Alexandrium_andersonii.AAC.1
MATPPPPPYSFSHKSPPPGGLTPASRQRVRKRVCSCVCGWVGACKGARAHVRFRALACGGGG